MKVLVEKDVYVPMRDGVRLATDVYRLLDAPPAPVLVQRTPYSKEDAGLRDASLDVMRAVVAGYAVVVQDVRGRYASEGEFMPFATEHTDGADTIEWASGVSWSDGNVGLFGNSYYGATQWLAASESTLPKAMAPFLTASDLYDDWSYQDGAFRLGFSLYWALLTLGPGDLRRRVAQGEASPRQLGAALDAIDQAETLFGESPLSAAAVHQNVPAYYGEWLIHDVGDEYWTSKSAFRRRRAIRTPSLNIGGWHDIFLRGTLRNYRRMRELGVATRLVIGPWAHGNHTGVFAERRFGARSSKLGVDVTGLTISWFDEHLKGQPQSTSEVSLFVMGADRWQDEASWPPPDSVPTPLFLSSEGMKEGGNCAGTLSWQPAELLTATSFDYDPRDPVPSTGGASFLPGLEVGANSGPRDQRPVEGRPDVLSYTSEPLDSPLTVIGPMDAIIFISSSAKDTDLVVTLTDVYPDGRSELVCDGILRLSHREQAEVKMMIPNEIYQVRVDLIGTAMVFDAGHRLRVNVTSSCFPRFDRNLNTGEKPAEGKLSECVVATNCVYTGPTTVSRVVLPIVQRK
ncbi:CocE/NonD family hydrolase [Streptomyces sp. NPDC001982]|uniref:CocE/NonD family hydrolase n=1 Tax=Streptomyces sp. NPDC001982 TaxID=3154405 RepID=UPI00331EC041